MQQIESPIMGIRAWVLDAETGFLASLHQTHIWKERTQQSFCQIMRSFMWPGGIKGLHHDAPQKNCHCGLHAYSTYEIALERVARHFKPNPHTGVAYADTIGIVSAWGKVILATEGFRSEYMRIEALIGEDEKTKEAAAHYGIMTITEEEVFAYMALSGGHLNLMEGGEHVRHRQRNGRNSSSTLAERSARGDASS